MAPGQGARRGGGNSGFKNHGAAANKRHGTTRTDKDGDLLMGSAPRNKDNRVGKPQGRGRNTPEARTNGSRAPMARAIQKDLAASALSTSSNIKSARITTPQNNQEFKITGWTGSKAAASEDRGASSLVQFLEKKATSIRNKTAVSKGEKAPRPVKIVKHQVVGDVLYVTARTEHTPVLLKLNGWEWAGTNFNIEKGQSPSSSAQNQTMTDGADDASQTPNVRDILISFIQRRYNPESKLLDLSAMGSDTELSKSGMFDKADRTMKFFQALMKVCDMEFKTAQEKKDTVHSVSLAGNGLTDLKAVTSLAHTFPDLKNLDLSNNQFGQLGSLAYWKNKYRHLDQLVLTGNPIEQQVPDYHETIKSWYPTLRLLNNVQIRSDEEIVHSTNRAKKGLPVKGQAFYDEGQIAENFIRTFFQGYDIDRQALLNMYYDAKSIFSFSVNTHSVRDPQSNTKPEAHEWDDYIKKSRNLKAISHLPARASRQHTGPASIAEIFHSLPATKHPELTEVPKWCIETMSMPGVPDPTGQSPVGVNGFLITIHGEFSELDPSSRQPRKVRSFDRTFIIGPGVNPGVAVRIVSDTLTIRAYGGHAAWQPEEVVDDETIRRNYMVQEFSGHTRLTLDFARQCLESVDWDGPRALASFENVKATLGPEAFIQG